MSSAPAGAWGRPGALRLALAPWVARLVGVEGLNGLDADGLPGERPCVVVGCSGGADSLALLALACAADLDPIAVYVDHGLRQGTAREAAVVERAAERLGAAGMIRAEVDAVIEPGPNLEARARDARYGMLERARSSRDAAAVLVGHTADDQAETVMLNLLRGSGSAGLAAMAVRRDRIVRPILGLRRADTREICARLGLVPVADPMNSQARFRRVWLRREVLPRLERGAGRDLGEVLARQAALMREESDYLDAVAASAAAGLGDPPSAAALAALPAALARRVVRVWLGDPPVTSEHVENVLGVASGGRRAAELPGGRRVERSAGNLRLVDAGAGGDGPRTPVAVPLPGRVVASGVAVESWVESGAPVAWPDGRWSCVVDADAAGPSAVLRGPVTGERLRPLGLGGSKLVADALAETGVAVAARPSSPVLAAGEGAAVPVGEPLWVVGYRIDHRVRVTTRTRRFLWLTAGSVERP